jgi:hypothetical protein
MKWQHGRRNTDEKTFNLTNTKEMERKGNIFQPSHCQRLKRSIISEIGEEGRGDMTIVGENVHFNSLLGGQFLRFY